jgi:predicted enzyme related to lactoylglutathione lyase
MPTPYGLPIWYELVTPDADAAKAFYGSIVGWTGSVFPMPEGGMPYHIWQAGDVGIGGMIETEQSPTGGPVWLAYFHVADVDAATSENAQAGGRAHLEPTDLPGIGRIALLEDPQGVIFYVMTPDPAMGDTGATSFSPDLPMRCAWNELTTTDTTEALPFYESLLGLRSTEAMAMGQIGDYSFLDAGGVRIGAMMNRMAPEQPVRWTFYFRVPDADAAAERIRAGGGSIVMGPMDVPGGERAVIALDPQGASVGFVSGVRA